MRKFIGVFANFEEEEVKRIKKAYKILKKVSGETGGNNRDTQILGGIVKELNWIVEQQYKEEEI